MAVGRTELAEARRLVEARADGTPRMPLLLKEKLASTMGYAEMRRNLTQLLAAGTLQPGTKLHHTPRTRPELRVDATVAAYGIEFNGQLFTTPTAAARAVTKRPVNGWLFWRLPSGQTLNSLR